MSGSKSALRIKRFFQVLLLSLFCCLATLPANAGAQVDPTITIGRFQGLSKTVTLPIIVSDFPDMAALRFKIEVDHTGGALVGITDFSVVDKALPASASWEKHLPDVDEIIVGIINFRKLKNGEIFNITITHEADPGDVFTVEATVLEAADLSGQDISSSIVLLDGDTTTYYGRIIVGRMFGDINGDDKVDVSDVVYALRTSVGSLTIDEADTIAAGRVSVLDGTPITAYDAYLIAQFVAGVINYFPVDSPPNLQP